MTDSRKLDLATFPFAFLGYGFLYAWGYVSWETPVLLTRPFNGTTLDITWLTSAITVPLALLVIALLGRRRELDAGSLVATAGPASSAHPASPAMPLLVLTPVIAVVGTLLSVIYQLVSNDILAMCLGIGSGLCTGIASALFITLWSLALSRLNMETLETLVPFAFIVSVLCALIVPSLSLVPALILAGLLAICCGVTLIRARVLLASGRVDDRYLEEVPGGIDMSDEATPADIVRMLVFGCIAWMLSCLASTFTVSPIGTGWGIDITSCFGFVLAILLALFIIRFAVRVDFFALAYMTLAPFVLCIVLGAFGTPVATFIAGILNTAMGVCFEIILLLFFIRLAQWKAQRRSPGQRTFYLAIGSFSGYLGVLIGTLMSFSLFGDAEVSPTARMGACLVLICVYVFAILLIPQRHPYAVEPMTMPAATAASAVMGASAIFAATAMPASHAALASPAPDSIGENAVSASDRIDKQRSYQGAVIDGQPDTAGFCDIDARDAIDRACEKVASRYQLSQREAEICTYLAHGRSQTYIRDALFLSKNTVATYTRHLYTKLDVHGKQELIDLVEAHEGRAREQ